MKTLHPHTQELIDIELRNIPEKYQKNFNSIHEGYAVILEEVRELENEVFFGEKKSKVEVSKMTNGGGEPFSAELTKKKVDTMHRDRMREECIQIAAMCARFIQELT